MNKDTEASCHTHCLLTSVHSTTAYLKAAGRVRMRSQAACDNVCLLEGGAAAVIRYSKSSVPPHALLKGLMAG